jgi:riboflavin kinase
MLRLLILIAQLGGFKEGADRSIILQKAGKSEPEYNALLEKAVQKRLLAPLGSNEDRFWITDDGRRLLEAVFHDLSIIFAGISEEEAYSSNLTPAVIGGVVESGLIEAARYVAMEGYTKRLHAVLGFTPFPGTLNIRIVEKEDRVTWNSLLRTRPKIIPEFDFEGRRFGMLHIWHAELLEPKIEFPPQVAIIRPFRTQHTELFEVISPHNLRKELGLQDGAYIKFQVAVSA